MLSAEISCFHHLTSFSQHPTSGLLINEQRITCTRYNQKICKLNILNLWQVLKRYRESNSKLDKTCSADPSAHEDCVAVLPYEMFDTLDFQNVNYYTGYCSQFAGAMNQPPKVCILLCSSAEAKLSMYVFSLITFLQLEFIPFNISNDQCMSYSL